MELTWANDAQPWQNKSPTGTATAASAAPSQYARSTTDRSLAGGTASHMCRITPGPATSATVCVPPAAISTDGDTFQPGPRSLAAAAPVPVAAPPPALLPPAGFSGLTERDRPSRSTDIDSDMNPPGPLVPGHATPQPNTLARHPAVSRSSRQPARPSNRRNLTAPGDKSQF